MRRPILKQEYDLTLEDLQAYPVWRGVHGADEEEKWYGRCDEATFRPWLDPLPADPAAVDLLLVAAAFTLANGTTLPGAYYSIPLETAGSRSSMELVGELQPRVFLRGRAVRFWGGLAGIGRIDREHFYSCIEASPERSFPITFEALPGVTGGVARGLVEGFYRHQLGDCAQEGIVEVDRTPFPQDFQTQEEEITEPGRPRILQLARKGQWQAAIDLATALISAHPTDPDAWSNRVVVHWMRGDLELAIADELRKIECGPSFSESYSFVCLLLIHAKRYDECITYCDVGLAATAGDPLSVGWYRDEMVFLGARALYETDRFSEAIERLIPLYSSYGMGRRGDTLMTKRALVKACKNALAKGRAKL